MTSPAAPENNLVEQPIWTGLMGRDEGGAFLVGGKCSTCGFTTLGLRDICPECWAQGTMTETAIGRRGRLYTYTVIHQLPHGYEEPFAVGYVDLDDGIRVFAHIENTPDCLVIGGELELTSAALRRDDTGTALTGPKYHSPNSGET